MRYKSVSKELFIRNRKKLIRKMLPESVVVINSNDNMPRNGDQFYPYRQNSDLYYLTGIDQEKTILVLYPDCPVKKLREILFILESNEQIETWYGHKLTKEEASRISGIEYVQYLSGFESVIDELMSYTTNVYLNSNEYPKFKPDVESRDLRMAAKFKKDYPEHTYQRIAPLLTQLRMQKEPEEIEQIRNACQLTNNAFLRILKKIKPGIFEYEVEAEILHEFTGSGATNAYRPIIASGKDACILHYIDNDKACKDGSLILMDFGAEYGNYAADCTRTIPVNGKFTTRQKDVYHAVLRVQEEIKKHFVVGNTIEEINKDSTGLVEKELIKLGLLKKDDISKSDKEKSPAFKYLMHGIAHFLGLDVHDAGTRFEKLKPGMVLTCEPAIYIKEEGIGIRIENDILITEDGPVDLMADIPVAVEEIEKLMG